MQIIDRLTLADLEVTGEGFLVAKATIARSGIQDYQAWELGHTDGDMQRIVRVYRPDDEVFSDDALRSFQRKPVTDGHPWEAVTAKNATKVTLGMTGEQVTRDDRLVRTTITLFDAGAVNDVQRGRRELSGGYTADLDWTAGITPDGEPYDAIQRNIRGNHVALVDAGRCGSECRIGDCGCGGSGASCSCGGRKVTDKTLKTITHDGVSIETTEQGAQVIDKLSKSLSDSKTALTDAEKRHADAIAAKDKELGEKDAEIAKLKDQQVKPGDLDKMVADRAAVVADAKAIAPNLDVTGKSLGDIRRMAVAARLGDEKVKDRSDDYIEATFDGLKENSDPLGDAFADGTPSHSSGGWNDNVFAAAGVAQRKEG